MPPHLPDLLPFFSFLFYLFIFYNKSCQALGVPGAGTSSAFRVTLTLLENNILKQEKKKNQTVHINQ